MKIRQHTRRLSAATLATAALATGLLTAPGAAAAGPPAHTPVQAGTPGPAQPFELTDWDRDAYRGQVEVKRTPENRKPRTDDHNVHGAFLRDPAVRDGAPGLQLCPRPPLRHPPAPGLRR